MKDRIYKEILKKIEKDKGLLFLVIDPPNQSPETSGKIARLAEKAGVDAITVGGSVDAQGKLLEDTITEIKKNFSLPVILFPGNIATVSKQADAIYFMSMLNSLDPYYISGAQIASAHSIKNIDLEPIPTSYIIVEPGRAAGWIGRAKLIPRELPYLGGITALAGQYMGSKLIILESGGGAPEPAPMEMISDTKKLIEVPLIVAGGVCTPDWAYKTIRAGADIVHVGAAIEKTNADEEKTLKRLQEFVQAVKKAGREKK